MRFRQYIWFITAIMVAYFSISALQAQTSIIGNGSAIAPTAGQLESYGINGMQADTTSSGYSTRHYYRANYSGIGSSFLQTTSPTSESTPATKATAPIIRQSSQTQFRLPKLDSSFSGTSNPALQSYTPSLPSMPRSPALESPTSRSSSISSYSGLGLEPLSSFSKNESITDQMQYSNFDLFGK